MLLIFGGLIEVTHETNDIYGFDFKSREWIRIRKENLTASLTRSPSPGSPL
jgi:hypothetical protein